MTINEYQQLALVTMNKENTGDRMLTNGVMGLCGEAGECVDMVKKYLFQGHSLDKEKLLKELGDVAWYLAVTAAALDTPLEDVLAANIEKLKKRYPDGFSAERSVNRDE